MRDRFIHGLSLAEKEIFIKVFCNCCKQQLLSSKNIFLEGFGILTGTNEKKSVTRLHEDKLVLLQTVEKNIQFQKCSELTALIRERYSNIIEEKELSEIILAELPLKLQIEWGLDKTRQYLAGLYLSLKHDTISQGRSLLISEIGDFYALHNRQGSNIEDWYAGANVIFKSNCNQIIKCGDCLTHDIPILNNSWEVINCIYGKPIHTFSINICKELKKLGFDLDRSYFNNKIENEQINVSIYANKNSKQQQLIYCTDGLRNLAINESNTGCELIFQALCDSDFRDSAKNSSEKYDDILLPDWPKTVLLMGWIMIQNSGTKCIEFGSVLTLNKKLCQDLQQSRLTAVFAGQYQNIRLKQYANEGCFYFVNLVGITDDEYRLSESNTKEILQTLLNSKRLDQLTKLCRPNLLSKTSILETTSSDLAARQMPFKTPAETGPLLSEPKSSISTN